MFCFVFSICVIMCDYDSSVRIVLSSGQLHQRHLHRSFFYRDLCKAQEREIDHASPVRLTFDPFITYDEFVFLSSLSDIVFLNCSQTWKVRLTQFLSRRWKDIGTIGHNKSAITVEITSKDDTIMFHMVSVETGRSARPSRGKTNSVESC